jgi:hypothetical protein
MNNKGQFSIIAALLVAVVLIASVMGAYSAIRYGSILDQPQILSSVDETNQALKQLLGFTVGYYGSVLQVTGNVTYAQQLAQNYLNSGIDKLGSIKPEWGLSLNTTQVELKANWYTNNSYSQGNMNVTYDLNGLGIIGVSYSASSRLEVQISNINSTTQAQFKILTDNGEPLINLGPDNIKFFQYSFGNLTWEFSVPITIISHADGTYIVDLPTGVPGNAYVVQVEDTRGLSVLASSYSEFTSTIAWNTTGYKSDLHYVDIANLNVSGTHSNFTSQQHGPDGVYDSLTEAVLGTTQVPSYPSNYNLLGLTTLSGGTINDLQLNDGTYMKLQSFPTAYDYNTTSFDTAFSKILSTSANSMSWSHTSAVGSNKILLVTIDTFRNGTPTTVTSITYDGTAMTQLATVLYSASNPQVRSYVFYLINPSSGTKTISVNFASSTQAVGGSIIYINVNQTNPFDASITNSGAGTSEVASLTASGSYGKMLFGHQGSYGAGSYIVADESSQTNRWSQFSQIYKGSGSEKSVTNGAVSMSWTTSTATNWVAIAVLLRPTSFPTEYKCEAEFSGNSTAPFPWNNLAWAIDSSASSSSVPSTFQLYNFVTGKYPSSGEGFMTALLQAGDQTVLQTIVNTPASFLNSSGYWKLNITAVKSTSSPFFLNLDFVQFNPNASNYAINLQEQWTNVNATNLRQDLCVKTGTMSSESLLVQVLQGNSWQNLTTLIPNYFNNISLAPYINSANLTIRFIDGNNVTDPIVDSWNLDSVYIRDEPDINFLVNQQQSTFSIETLQNGTMLWLGQNMKITTQNLPIPPIPVKAIHVNQTINGVNQEVPFQIEDWASNYQIPLGLTSNTTLFGNRQMIVFLLNSKVTDFTIWWNGSDAATQTPLAFINKYFTNDNTAASTLTNGNVTLLIGSFNVKATVAGSGNYSTATFMRINQQNSTYGAGVAYVIHHGVVRDVVQQEAEWNNGPTGSPNLYANIVLTFPANATYYTYNLRIMFISSSQPRAISDLSPIQITTSLSSVQLQTENATLAGSPIIQNGTGTFLNSASGNWTPHHFSQFLSSDGKGAGIMFTDQANQKLYAFDAFPASTSKGALRASNGLLELLPVSSSQVQFTYAYDVTWQGAVVTFDRTTPICNLYSGTTPMGLWILAEYPPTLTVTAKS